MSKLIKQWLALRNGVTLAVYTSPCIVTRPPPLQHPSTSRALVNPANEQLIGTVLPYFPMGGPPPSGKLNTSIWGAASAGPDMFYPVQSVDGILTLHGGSALREACNCVPLCKGVELIGGGGNRTGGFGLVRCPVGSAVTTPAFGETVTKHYGTIVHTVPPLWPGRGGSVLSEEEAKSLLCSSICQALKVAFNFGVTVATMPLVGAGARRAPVLTAIECAVQGIVDAISSFDKDNCKGGDGQLQTIEIVVLEPHNAGLLVHALDTKFPEFESKSG